MKNNKGITLISLVIYMAVIILITAMVMRITTNFSNNMEDVADTSFETEFNKLNLYLLDESKRTNNAIQEIVNGTQITFSGGNKYTYNIEDKVIYLNDTIKICENVESCLIEEKVAENGKSALDLTIKIGEIEKTVTYVIKNLINDDNFINEEDYIFNMGEEPPKP